MPCNPPQTNVDKKWVHEEYYIGERDEENRKHGKGTHHWSGAESLEWYTGCMLRDTMHGYGDYRWRYLGSEHIATTYEGRFYNNCMHGYGVMSYPDGRVFNGLYHKNIRWGPGVESHACLRQNVGLWYGYQLTRLAWKPALPSVAIDFMSHPMGSNVVTPHRILLTTDVKIIGQVNSAIELLKQSGCEPLAAAEKWTKLYSKYCTDLSSQLCHVEAFDRAYYCNKINLLNEVTAVEPKKTGSQSSTEIDTDKTNYYAWNNNKIIIHMMKHCFTHEGQRNNDQLNLKNILSGSRTYFKPAGKHEMDCRTLIMASYLGHISNVAQLINECDVSPDVTDAQGNSVLMYAACGDQPETIHFLVEAGAEVDAYNDACCTPLGITLLRYALEKLGVAHNAMLQALLPPTTAVGPPPLDENIFEWEINRIEMPPAESLIRHSSKGKLNQKPFNVTKRNSIKDLSTKKKTETFSKTELQKSGDNDMNSSTDAINEDKRIYDKINTEYMIRVAEVFSEPSEVNPIPYMFQVNDMCKDVELFNEEETKKVTEKSVKSAVSKVMKVLPMKPSRDTMFQDKEDTLVDVIDVRKREKMSRIMSTVLQLLSEGADPRKVRCPQPPLFIAAVSGSAELIRHLVKHGADINEVYPQAYGYSTLDVAVSGPLTNDNLEVIRVLLECGADPDHRLQLPQQPLTSTSATNAKDSEINQIDGPTLLHAVLARKVDSEADNIRMVDLRDQLLELLLQYGCNPLTQYKGRSAVEIAINKSLDLFDIFLKSPRTDLNAVINDSNQTILVKMFYMPFCKNILLPERLQMLTKLLLFGADPLIKCQNGNDEYGNLFVFTKHVLSDMDSTTPNTKLPSQQASKIVKKSKSEVKQKKPVKSTASKTGIGKTSGKPSDDNIGDYKQALDLVVECARLLYIRWLQAKLMKELIEIVNQYKHRHWTMILKEHKNKKCTSLWLTVVRSLEIWDALKTTKKKRTNILRRPSIPIWRKSSITFREKEFIEREVARILREHKLATMLSPDMVPSIRPYVTPELMLKEVEKFNVCFDCAIPLGDVKIPCDSCNLIGFCSFDCMKTNIDRINCHPCSNYLKEKYFPTPEETETNSEEIVL